MIPSLICLGLAALFVACAPFAADQAPDKSTSTPVTVESSPPATPSPTPAPVHLAGAGDIASCALDGDELTARLLDALPEATVFTAGDNAYERGTAAEFRDCYEPTWGRHRARTRPAVGNHEYGTAEAKEHFAYFGPAAGEHGKGYYSYDLGSWHVVVLNSNCAAVGGCSPGSEQERWLRADLTAHPSPCTLAIWHHAAFSSGRNGSDLAVRPLWAALAEARAELVIAGHDHNYERFAPQDAQGRAEPAGIRGFVVGTGGASLRALRALIPNSEKTVVGEWGILHLILRHDGYDWRFVTVGGATADSGSEACR